MVLTDEGARTESISLLVRVKKIDQRNGNSLLSLLDVGDYAIYASLRCCYVSLWMHKDDVVSMLSSAYFFFIYIMLFIYVDDIASVLSVDRQSHVLREHLATP